MVTLLTWGERGGQQGIKKRLAKEAKSKIFKSIEKTQKMKKYFVKVSKKFSSQLSARPQPKK